MKSVTILTPTYNRASTISRLYASLKRQTCMDFEWLIIDDGSTDNTKELISGFIAENILPITYVYKSNGGKHTALNTGVKQISSIWIFIVDSDDMIPPDAVKQIVVYGKKYASCEKIAAMAFKKSTFQGKELVKTNAGEHIDSYINYRIKEHRPGDMAEVFKTKILVQFPFPEFENEKFLSEAVIWIEISRKYNFVFIDQTIYLCEYLPDGLTANSKKLKFASPLGSMLYGKQLMTPECGIKENLKGAIIYNVFKRAALLKREYFPYSLSARERCLVLCAKPFGRIFFHLWDPDRQNKEKLLNKLNS